MQPFKYIHCFNFARYILLPALLGDLTLQVSATDRLDTIQKARVYFVDYLQRSKSYAVTSEVCVCVCHCRQSVIHSIFAPLPFSFLLHFHYSLFPLTFSFLLQFRSHSGSTYIPLPFPLPLLSLPTYIPISVPLPFPSLFLFLFSVHSHS